LGVFIFEKEWENLSILKLGGGKGIGFEYLVPFLSFVKDLKPV
jgi:hypothetical protein